MSKHSIDELFRKRFSGLEEPYPEHVWERVKKELHGVPEKSRRGAFWWIPWAGMSALLIVAGIWMYREYAVYSENQAHPSMAEITAGSQDDGLIATTGQEVGKNRDDISTSANTNSGQIGQTDIEVPAMRDQDRTAKASSSFQKSGTSVDEDLSATSVPFTVKTTSNPGTSDSKNENFDYATNSTLSSRITDSNLGAAGKNNEADFGGSMKSAGSIDSDFLTHGNLSQRSQIVSQDIGMLDRQRLMLSGDNSQRSIRKYVPILSSYGQNAIRLKWSIAPIYGHDFVQRSVLARNPEDQALAYYRREHEFIVNAFTVGTEIGIKWHSWTLYTGLHYAQINDRYEYTVDDVVRNATGGPVNGVLKRSIVNRYSSLEIPILAEYGWGHKNWRMGAIVGIQAGVQFNATGEVFDDLSLQAVDMADQNIYRSNLGIVPVIGMSLGYKIGYNSLLFVRPSFKYYRGSMTRGDYGVDQQLTTTSFLFGLRYNLN